MTSNITVLPARIFLAISTLLRLSSGIIVLLFCSRYLAARELGTLSLMLAVASLISIISDAGQSGLITYRVGRAGGLNIPAFRQAISMRLLFSVAISAASIFLLLVFDRSVEGRLAGITVLVAVQTGGFIDLFSQYLRATRKLKLDSLVCIISVFILIFFPLPLVY
jgi:O-antigen/teichoic acid export membrane protein